jgi:acyl transferase domain-containing protein/NAD(P)-dependent dehydrogenase (short-subunit alcohol dehydrogenase family)/acyl carrier protein
MEDTAHRAIAIVGVGAILPDAPNVSAFWNNVTTGRYCISEVPPDRWDPASYYDADPNAPDKTYSKIGGWVREYPWDPMKWRLPIPPKVADGMDLTQKWAVACTREALEDYGYPKRPLDLDRTAVILGNAMAGEKHYLSSLRVFFPEYAKALANSSGFAQLPRELQHQIREQLHEGIGKLIPPITEDTMPGELANCMAGRIANLYNFHGPNYVCDAACASAMAAITSAVEGLVQRNFDVVVTGGIDRNMGAPTFVKFCKIGALSATGTRPFAQGADGFVMGEGAVIFLLKRLADAEHDQDKIYAVLRGIGGASDGKGKGITAPNPIGQKFSVERAWRNAGVTPTVGTLIEAHGTSTRVGDVVEASSMVEVLSSANLPVHSVALGSVKSNIGHLKGAAGGAGILKAALSLHNKVLPPSLHCETPSPDIDFAHSPLYVNTELRPWDPPNGDPRRVGVSAFGFGGTNFHVVMEEHIPGRLTGNGKKTIAVPVASPVAAQQVPVQVSSVPVASSAPVANATASIAPAAETPRKAPLRGALLIGAATPADLLERLKLVQRSAQAGQAPPVAAPADEELAAPERLAIDYADAADLASKCGMAVKAFAANQAAFWKALRAQGIFRGHGPAPKVAFLYTGQGSQYVNMLRGLREKEAVVAETFNEADRIMEPLLGKPLTDFIYVDPNDPTKVAEAEDGLRQTAITQPAVISINIAQTRLLATYGIRPDMTMGHSVGEYGALVAAGAMPFEDALEAVSARGREMTRVSMKDNGKMAAVFAPIAEVERILKSVDGYVVIANVNSNSQSVIGGGSEAIDQAVQVFTQAGFNVVELPVSHAFHTSIVAPASAPLKQMLSRLHLQTPQMPIVANINGDFYPSGVTKDIITDMLAQQVAAPVQFVKGLRTLYDAGARVFVEVGPKKALQGFADDVLGSDPDVFSLFTNHPKLEDLTAFNQALCGMYAAGLGRTHAQTALELSAQVAAPVIETFAPEAKRDMNDSTAYKKDKPRDAETIVITGAAVGLPGTEHTFDDSNVARLLNGDQFIGSIPERFRRAMLEKNVIRLVKSDNGGPVFETIHDTSEVLKLAGRGGAFDIETEFGLSAERVAALDRVTCLAIAAGVDALRDAGIPLVMRYKKTTKGTYLPDRWGLPDQLRDDTGVIFGSAFPGYDSYAQIMGGYYIDHARREELARLEKWTAQTSNGHSAFGHQIAQRIDELRGQIEKEPYVFDRRFLFRVLSMGHSQFAEYIGARGPNTQINAACATTTQAVTIAQDWISAGRCRRVIVITADDVTSDNMIEWFGAGFLASGAAATDELVQDAATPFDRRRHGLIMGMGAAALVVESSEAARQRGIRPICEVLGSVTANSAFHGSRLDVNHITQVMEKLLSDVEKRHGLSRFEIAPRTVFISHETYTPARGGSASAEIFALRSNFGARADQIVIANTKGYTGHAMATGIEDVLAVKSLETGFVPPVPNFKEVDPELGVLNLAKGGEYPVEYALRLGAGFGSQISMTLSRWVKTPDGKRPKPNALGYKSRIADTALWATWLDGITGHSNSELEVVKRTLRVRDQGPQARVAAPVEEVRPVHSPVPPAAPGAAPVVRAPAAAAIAIPASMLQTEVAVAEVHSPTKSVEAAPVGSVKERIISLVVEKTGYPEEMLDLDLDMEADLGVDTVKQAEIFAAIRESYNIPRDDNRKLRDYPTLAHVIRFVYENRPDLAGTVVSSAQATATVPAAPSPARIVPAAPATDGDVKQRILALVVEKTGYPEEMLDLDLDMEADLGVDTVKQAEIFAAIRQTYDIPREENRKLRDYPTLAHVIRFVYENRPDLTGAAAASSAGGVTTPTPEPPTSIQIPATDPLPKVTSGLVSPATGDVKKRVLALVVEKTGYPEEMLDLDLDLEADLGVDTVKQAEMFAAIREMYNIPRDENRKLRDYPTLAHVIGFVFEMRPDLAGGTSAAKQPEAKTEPAPPTLPEAATAVIATATAEETGMSLESIQQKVLDIVAEKTGYPKEMLDPDLDLEADLGIDTVKQAEMFASVRAAYNIPRDENLKLRDFPTLAHVIKFAQDRAGGATTAPNPTSTGAMQASVTAPAVRPELLTFDAANKIPRRVPIPVLRPPLAICKPTGVTLSAGSRVIVMPDAGGVALALCDELLNKGADVLCLSASADTETLLASVDNWLKAGPVQGIFWLPALDDEVPISGMDICTWHEALRTRVKSLYAVMRKLYAAIAPEGTFLMTATRLGGQHGYDDCGAVAPMGGAVVGFTKAYKRERLEATVKAVDFEPRRDPQEIATLLIDEAQRDPGAVEIGYKDGLRWTVGLQEQPAADGLPGLTLNRDSVFVITGAAGSIVSAITQDLAAASGGIFYLLDLVPEPDPNNPDLGRFISDKDGLKRELFARIQARGERATPAMIEKELAALERGNAALSAIRAVQSAGGTAHYFSVNLADAAAVARVIAEVRKRSGRIDALLHAAGLERSHFMADKDQKEFDLVFDVKADGWFNLLHAIADMPLGATVSFSSVAGRFGNGGQTDYSSANDLLCKYTSSFRSTRPQTRGIVIDWTAWGGIGMATRGSIPKMMELAGIDMLPPEAGIPIIRRELTTGGFRGEIVVAQRLGLMLQEWDSSGGLDVVALENSSEWLAKQGPMVGRITGVGVYSGLMMETTLDPKQQPFLYDHQIDGTPVLPGVMGIEAFAELALSLHPGWYIDAIEEVNFLAPFKFYKQEPRTVILQSLIHPAAGKLVAECRLIGRRTLPNSPEPQETTHFTARVRLRKQAPQEATAQPPCLTADAIVSAAQIYRIYFHGPAYRVMERAWWDGERIIGEMSQSLPENHQPSDKPTLIWPRLIELCFQTAGLWQMASEGTMGLPWKLGHVSTPGATKPNGEKIYAMVKPHPEPGSFDAEVVDSSGKSYLRLRGYRTIALPHKLPTEPLKNLQSSFSLHELATT